MKEKIEQLAKGIFEYTKPSILLSDEELELSVEVSKTLRGSFSIKSWESTSIKGIVYSSHHEMRIINEKFIGTENVIEYEASTASFLPGEKITGTITIVSNLGEIEIPFTVNVELPYCTTSLGKIKDLYQFANLAKEDWHEALKIFKSEEFSRVFLRNDERERLLYQSLLASRSSSMALEEFLIAIHKKVRINLSIDKIKENYTVGNESIMDKVTITKDNWGFAELRVSTDTPFIELDHKIIWTDYFLGSSFSLEYVLKPEFMRDGNNFGTIIIKSVHQTMEIEISCKCNKSHKEKDEIYLRKRILEQLFVTNYLKFRIRQIDVNEYLKKTDDIINTLTITDTSDISCDLIRTHLYIITKNDDKAKLMLEQFKEIKEELKKKSVKLYCGYLYLNALFYKEDDIIEEAVKEINQVYVTDCDDFNVLWYLLYLDRKYDVNKNSKLAELKKHFQKGSHSPILYYEAYSLYKEDPSLLHELKEFEIQVMNWATKNSYITHELMEQYTYLASRIKGFHRVIYNCLSSFYEQEESKDILTAICSMLIKGHKTSTKYFHWFQLGVNAQLRITDLYEYYMYTIDEAKDTPLEQQILFYYLYNSSLSDKKKAYLYSRIVKNKEKDPTVYHTYIKKIEQFAIKQIQLHNISENLSILYDDVLKHDMIDEDLAAHLPEIMFHIEIHCTNRNIKGIYVIHKEIEEEIYVPFVDGRALVSVYTSNALIFLVDLYDNRFVATIDYTMNRLMHSNDFKGVCYSMNPSQTRLVLPMLEDTLFEQKNEHDTIELKKNALKIEKLRMDYRKAYIKSLIYFYNDRIDRDLLLYYIEGLGLEGFNRADRNKVVEFLIDHKVFHRALEIMEEYGYEDIKLESLIPFCIYYMNQIEGENNTFLVGLCYDILREKCRIEAIVTYLVKHFSNTTKEMYELYLVAKELQIDTTELEKRLLVQMLFSNSKIEQSYNVFEQLYHRGKERKLIRAYLSFIAYEYLMNEKEYQDELLGIMKHDVIYEENTILMLAILKRLSQEETLSDEDEKLVELNVNEFLEEGVVLPFFREFKDKIALPEKVVNSYFIEYKAHPSKKVFLHYRISSSLKEEQKYDVIAMKNTYQGIFVEQFLLFYGETLEYYISEEGEKGEKVTETIQVTLDNKLEAEDDNESKYNQINLMLMTKDLKDDETLYQLIETYKKKELAAFYLFTAL